MANKQQQISGCTAPDGEALDADSEAVVDVQLDGEGVGIRVQLVTSHQPQGVGHSRQLQGCATAQAHALQFVGMMNLQ